VQTYALIAIGVGLVIGGVTGGRLTEIAGKRFRLWGLLLVGMIVQVVLEYEHAPAPFLLLLVSYTCLTAFSVANLRLRGMGVVLIGVALNALVIAANSGMPVREDAVRAAGMIDRDKPVRVRDAKHTLEAPDTKFAFLGDVVPVAPMRQVVSFGDLILAVGIADLVVRLMRPERRSRRLLDLDDDARDDAAVLDLTRLERSKSPAGARL
jgi:MFS family permease